MAEAFLKRHGGGLFEAESAGLEPGTMTPNVVTVMREIGVDLSHKSTQGVFDLFRQDKRYDAVITVCDKEAAERCPFFPGNVKRIAWSFKDPSALSGSAADILQHTREIRDEIEQKIKTFVREASQLAYWL
jgi:arsenate reductase